MKITTSILIAALFLLWPTISLARVTPEDILNTRIADYLSKVKNYSAADKQKLEDLSQAVAVVNKTRTDQLERIMLTQAAILDEYQKRFPNKNGDGVDKARYWITYAHEAVAYQAAKVYVFDLTSEKNIKNDALNLISLFQSDLNSARSKVINSQNILRGVIQ
ncbi:hypothetical protein HY389_00895 [Candidatus Daviesbacteria bacterium]|nr:hypothetical protein [Candidatus Daviesbacteria bacterium]